MEKGDVKKASAIMISAVFIGFLLYFGVGFLTNPYQEASYTEQRSYAHKPEFSVKSFMDGSYTSGLENYLSDHILMRSTFVTLCSESRNILGKPIPFISFRGKNGQFFLRNKFIESTIPVTVENFRGFAEKQNVPVDMLLVPDAACVLTEDLPFAYLSDDEDELYKDFSQAVSGAVEVYYPKEKILELKSSGMKVYYKTDQHWTTDCARAVLDWYMEQSGQTVRDVTYEEYESPAFFGNLYSSSPFFFDEPETLKYYVNPDGSYKVEELDTGRVTDSILNEEWFLGVRNRYNVFLNEHFTNTHITSNAEGGKLLLMGDSYLMPLVPFLADRFSEVRIIDIRQFEQRDKSISELLGDFHPDRVLIVDTVFQVGCGAVRGLY